MRESEANGVVESSIWSARERRCEMEISKVSLHVDLEKCGAGNSLLIGVDFFFYVF